MPTTHAVSASIALLIHLKQREGGARDATAEWLETHSHFQGDAGEGDDRNYIVLIPLGDSQFSSWCERVSPPSDLRQLFADTREQAGRLEVGREGLSYFEVTLEPLS